MGIYVTCTKQQTDDLFMIYVIAEARDWHGMPEGKRANK